MPTKKTEINKTTKKPEVKKKVETPKKEEFSFGAKRMTKEERDAIIEAALTPKSNPTPKYTIEETEYTPDKWVVVLTPNGYIYQEPVPRYFDYQSFTYLLASFPDKPLNSSNKIDFDAEIFKTSFEVKGVECYIITISTDGSRTPNAYSVAFQIKNGTTKVGGNLVFGGGEKGFTKKESSKVVEQIIKTLDNYEEKIEFK